jgi:Flp pilus assembly protein TadG
MPRRSFPVAARPAASAVELALLLPFLMSLLLGIGEVGRYADAQMLLQGTAREGARHATAESKLGASQVQVS